MHHSRAVVGHHSEALGILMHLSRDGASDTIVKYHLEIGYDCQAIKA